MNRGVSEIIGGATIDGREVHLHEGDTILTAARRAGIHIPTLCYSDDLKPEGGCRMCLVEIDGKRRPSGACHTPITPGMVVHTDTQRLTDLRRGVLSLSLSKHVDEQFRPDAGGSEFERLMHELNVTGSMHGNAARDGEAIDDSHPYLRFDRDACITCRRCLNACEQIQGQFVYGIEGRGAKSRLIFGPGERFADSACVACGACVEHCPTGAISDRDRVASAAAEPDRVTDSVCGYCGVGCRLRIEAHDNKVVRISAPDDAAVNHGHLCVKGRYAHAYHHSPDRLTRPLLRDEVSGELKPVSWDEAIAWAATRLAEIRDAYGPACVGCITSSRSTNEAGYLLQKLFRTALGSNNVDCCARICHSSTALALQTVTGTGAASASLVDIERASTIVVAGANPTEAHPVVGARIKEAVLRGAKLVVVDPRRIELAEFADLHLALRPGTNVPLFNAIARAMVDRGWIDEQYVTERCEGYDEFVSFTDGLDYDEAAEITGVSVKLIKAAAELIGRSGPALFVHGLGLSELTQGTASIMTLCNIGMLTGSIGKPGAGMLPLRGQNNVQGHADMGAMPNQLTGYQPLDDPAVRARFTKEWGVAPPLEPGIASTDMVKAAHRGELKAMWVQGEDVAQSEPNQTHTIEALRKLELLIIQDLYACESTEYAHLVLPAAGALEQEGTFTNGERRIQHVRPAVDPPGEARPDWRVVADVAAAMGHDWGYTSPADVMAEIARVAPAKFGGVSYDRLTPDGLQWPCPTPDHPGTATVHADGFLRGKGLLVSIPFVPSPEHDQNGFPLLLITGRVLQHYNVGTMTRRTPNRDLVDMDYLELAAHDAARFEIEPGDTAEIHSRWGRTEAPVRITDRIVPGTAFLSFHFPESHANCLVGPQVDPQSRCPEYKVTAIRVRRAGSESVGR
ncbi:MAG: formate dehydrogenase subunit alpha [Phycisphaera sp.]|nr:formate dehydrogenase subunit alpha [Phycisphaera sp.]